MKNINLLLLIITTAFSAKAQVWSGTTPGDIFYNSGNIGIGTASPSHLLHVKNGNMRIEFNSIYSYDPIMNFQNEGTGANISQDFLRWSGTLNKYWGTRFHRAATDGFKIQMAWPSPLGELSFADAIHITNHGVTSFFNSTHIDLSAKTGAGGRDAHFIKTSADNTVGIFLVERDGPESADGFAFWNKDLNTSIAKLGLISGYVESAAFGIGTKNPDPAFRLSVNGPIRAKEIKVETEWSDFVFSPNYSLRSLEEVENFISENQHLPNIPSADEVKNQGIFVGEMNAKLLEKIEELTLYLIEQNKRLNHQQREIEDLKAQLGK